MIRNNKHSKQTQHLYYGTFEPEEMDVLSLAINGIRYRSISELLGISIGKVSKIMSLLYAKTNCKSRDDLVWYIVRAGWKGSLDNHCLKLFDKYLAKTHDLSEGYYQSKYPGLHSLYLS